MWEEQNSVIWCPFVVILHNCMIVICVHERNEQCCAMLVENVGFLVSNVIETMEVVFPWIQLAVVIHSRHMSQSSQDLRFVVSVLVSGSCSVLNSALNLCP